MFKKKKKKVETRELGLEVGLVFMKYFLKTDYLHYGYWEAGQTPDLDIRNFGLAQQRYADFLINNIPDEVKSILDIGCGTGRLALELANKNFQVECVSPKNKLSEYAKSNILKDKVPVYEFFFEDFDSTKKYDVMLFSESFQYINMRTIFEKAKKFLNHNGYILICDFFKNEMPDKGPLGGGHLLKDFYSIVKDFPLEIVKDIDITERTAPTMDIVAEFLDQVGKPVWNHTFELFNIKYPLILKFLTWKFNKKIIKINSKYFSGKRCGKNFSLYKSYRLLLLKYSDTVNNNMFKNE